MVFTGLRPGEKLYEELLIGSSVSSTSHPLISRAEEHHQTESELRERLDRLRQAILDEDMVLIKTLLQESVVEYQPETYYA